MREVELTGAAALKDGEMKAYEAGETNVLLARVNGNFHALGATCPHYGAPLAEGALCGTRIICPWHHASFDVTTGDLLEPPAFDALPRYDVRIEKDQVFVVLPDEVADRRTPPMVKGDIQRDKRTFVIVGGGAAGYMAAQTLREDGFQGRVVMITREDRLPYDRPNLSKDYLEGHAEPEWMPLRPDEFFTLHDIEIMRGREVTRIDASARTITFSDGESITYDVALVATGGMPRELQGQREGLPNIFLLRSYADADAIIGAAVPKSRAVVIGASFIGMEVASSLIERQCSVTVVAPGGVPFEKTLGAEIGAYFKRLHESHGVKFRLGANVAGFEGTGKAEAVVLENGDRLEADLVLVGVGVKPATAFLTGVELSKDGGVIVDEHLRASDSLFAAGDVAAFVSALTGERTRIEHWRTALQQGRIAAHNMLGKNVPYDSVPFFWTRQFGVSLQYVGHAKEWDWITILGSLEGQDFLAFYVKEKRILAVAGMNRGAEIATVEGLMRENRMPSPDEVRKNTFDFKR
jgi:NADPH-dependent 2,4-dienoyl-CoA reductase/sulfur reductase-like enzyme/nitrite reductase/ring-hydroxylating ferredoxin subunit